MAQRSLHRLNLDTKSRDAVLYDLGSIISSHLRISRWRARRTSKIGKVDVVLSSPIKEPLRTGSIIITPVGRFLTQVEQTIQSLR